MLNARRRFGDSRLASFHLLGKHWALSMDNAAFATSWQRAWAALGVRRADEALYRELLARYQEPHRHYHSLRHLAECLRHFESVYELADRPGEVELALWFHDAVYQARRSDNEQRSADWARQALVAAGVEPAVAVRVYALVMATRHETLPATPDQRLLVDIDLAILGAPPARFAEYQRQVRAEYRWVPGPIYRRRRREILRQFLERQPLYATAYFQERLEAQARRNLAGALNE